MKVDLDRIELAALGAQRQNPGPWQVRWTEPENPTFADRVDRITDSAPRPDWCDSDERWIGEDVLIADSGVYPPRGVTATHIAQCSPDVVLALVARIRQLEAMTCRECTEPHGDCTPCPGET